MNELRKQEAEVNFRNISTLLFQYSSVK